MMGKLQKAIDRYCGENPESKVLLLFSYFGEQEKGEWNLKVDNTDSEYFDVASNYTTINLGDRLDTLFAEKTPESYESVNAEVKKISIYKGFDEAIPPFTLATCMIEFIGGKARLLDKIKERRETKDKEKHQFLYLTTKSVYDKILEMYNSETETPLG
jgi:hypothetical protein